MRPNQPTQADASAHVPSNVDDGDRGDILFMTPDAEASPVAAWLGGFVADGAPPAAPDGLGDGLLEPALAPDVVLSALTALGIEVTPKGRRTWSHIDAMLTTPHPNVYVGVLLGDDDGPGSRLKLGVGRAEAGPEVTLSEAGAAVRSTMARLRSALPSVPGFPPVPPLRPFGTRDGERSISQIAARKGVTVDPEAAIAIDRLQEAANVESLAMAEALRDGTLSPEDALERTEVGKRAWLVEAHRLVGAGTVTALLGDEAVPSEPPPEAPGWPYWLRTTAALGLDMTKRKGSFELMTSIHYLCGHGGHAAIDAAYRRLDVSGISEIAMLTLLRTPFVHRGRLAEWEGFRERVRAELLARGKPADAILVGLGKPGDPPDGGPGLPAPT